MNENRAAALAPYWFALVLFLTIALGIVLDGCAQEHQEHKYGYTPQGVLGVGVPCSGTTYADAGGGIQVVLGDAGPVGVQFGAFIGNPSTNPVSLFVSCSGNVTAAPGANQGREIPPGQERCEPSSCLPYVASDAGSLPFTCERF
jgi:hypothetical protein